ncbi:hypothetical protein LCGC14_2747180 [marine sediment metagenome]|uniref:Uncharacterized protein n=1 Tax=marine sediment metagenome TaxID=412755 RepID=A0A0F8ZPU9_9ZZZZ
MAAKKKGKDKKKKKGSAKSPLYSIAFSAKKGKSKYTKGPSLGLWESQAKQVLANGAVKEDRLDDLIEFLRKQKKKDNPIYIALFKNKKKKKVKKLKDWQIEQRKRKEDKKR